MNKWIGISLGTVVGISHIGMIGMLANRSSFPQLNLPIGEYTSYSVEAGKEGYRINYRANDPLRLGVRKSVERPAGFLGFGKSKTSFEEQYTMDGLATYRVPLTQRSVPPVSSVSRRQVEENRQERLWAVASVPLLVLLVLPLCLMWVGCLLVLLLCSAWNKEQR